MNFSKAVTDKAGDKAEIKGKRRAFLISGLEQVECVLCPN